MFTKMLGEFGWDSEEMEIFLSMWYNGEEERATAYAESVLRNR